MSKSEDNFGVQGSQQHTPAEVDEHAIISGVHGKKVFVVDSAGSQIDGATEAKQDTANTLLGGIAGLVPTAFDYIALTYVAAGNGVGEVETAIFKTGGSGGTTVATLTLTYNASNEVAIVTKA